VSAVSEEKATIKCVKKCSNFKSDGKFDILEIARNSYPGQTIKSIPTNKNSVKQ
jgi:hypothetical protein